MFIAELVSSNRVTRGIWSAGYPTDYRDDFGADGFQMIESLKGKEVTPLRLFSPHDGAHSGFEVTRLFAKRVMLSSVTVSCPGRVCLAGEYLDWLSGPSVLAAISLRLRIHLSWLPANSGCLVLESGLPLNITSRIPLSDVGAYERRKTWI